MTNDQGPMTKGMTKPPMPIVSSAPLPFWTNYLVTGSQEYGFCKLAATIQSVPLPRAVRMARIQVPLSEIGKAAGQANGVDHGHSIGPRKAARLPYLVTNENEKRGWTWMRGVRP